MKTFTVTANSLDSSWMAKAACRGRTDLFFPATGGPPTIKVKAICAGCPVRRKCAAYADALPETPDGVWAGGMRRR